MTSALVVTNGACRPCASASRLSTNTMARPPRMPMMVPSTACSASTASTCRPRPFARRQILDQQHGEQDRERIVAAGFDLERRADARAQAQAAGMDQEEHRRGIGRGHDRADQQRLAPAHVEQVPGDRRGQPRGDHDADGRQHGRGRQHAAEGRKPGTQAAVEQDQRQRDRADHIGHAARRRT